MDDDARRHDVDSGLRAALAPPPDLVTRVVSRALTPTGRVGAVARGWWGIAAASLLVLAGSAAWWQRVARPLGSPSSLTVVGSGAMLVVHGDGGYRWLIAPGAERSASGHYVIVIPD